MTHETIRQNSGGRLRTLETKINIDGLNGNVVDTIIDNLLSNGYELDMQIDPMSPKKTIVVYSVHERRLDNGKNKTY